MISDKLLLKGLLQELPNTHRLRAGCQMRQRRRGNPWKQGCVSFHKQLSCDNSLWGSTSTVTPFLRGSILLVGYHGLNGTTKMGRWLTGLHHSIVKILPWVGVVLSIPTWTWPDITGNLGASLPPLNGSEDDQKLYKTTTFDCNHHHFNRTVTTILTNRVYSDLVGLSQFSRYHCIYWNLSIALQLQPEISRQLCGVHFSCWFTFKPAQSFKKKMSHSLAVPVLALAIKGVAQMHI